MPIRMLLTDDARAEMEPMLASINNKAGRPP
jgi:hypothetical protein